MDLTSKFVYNFSPREVANIGQFGMECPLLAWNVVMGLACGLEGRGHRIVMDNYFMSIPLFMELALLQIYTIGTMWFNCLGLLLVVKNLCVFCQSS